MTSRTPWGRIAGLFSLKAILLACIFTPLPVTTSGLSMAYAQFQIIIPGFGYRRGYRSRGYRHRSGRRGSRAPAAGDTQPSSGTGKVGVGSSRGGKD